MKSYNLCIMLVLCGLNTLFSQSLKLQLSDAYIIDIAVSHANSDNCFYYGDQDYAEITYYCSAFESRDYYYRIPIPSSVKNKTITKVLFHIYKEFGNDDGYGHTDNLLTINELGQPLYPSYEKLQGFNPTPALIDKNYDTVVVSANHASEWVTFDVTGLFLSWLHDEKSNNGIAIKPLNESCPVQFSTYFYQSGNPHENLRPYFELFGPSVPDTVITTGDYHFPDEPGQEENTVWTSRFSGTSQNLLAVSFIDKNSAAVVGENGTILKSTDGGIQWTSQQSGTQNNLRGISFLNSSTGVAVGDGGTILRTTDGGEHWQSQTSGTNIPLNGVAFTSTTSAIIVGGSYSDTGTVLRSTDQGISWQPHILPCNALLAVSFTDENNGIAVGYSNGLGVIFHITDGGIQWTPQLIPANTGWLYGVHVIKNQVGIIVGEFGIVLLTTDGGIHWNPVNAIFQHFRGAYIFDENNFVIAGLGTLMRTTDKGQSWKELTSSPTMNAVSFVDSVTGVAVGSAGNIVTTKSGGLTTVKSSLTNPSTFFLCQNYPNPSNPSTTIIYSLAHSTYVTLKLFDYLGRKIFDIDNGYRLSGVHILQLDLNHLSSGAYFYQLNTDSYSASKKLILLK